jgi:hypothetical protein
VSQPVGQVFKSRIPTLGDDASIQEALRVYHYGVDNYSVQTIPDDSIEGNFRSLDTRLDSVESTISGSLSGFVRFVSQSSAPNIITGQTVSIVPLTVRAIASQSVPIQQWQNSSNTNIATISTGGSISLAAYLSIGSISAPTTIAASINILNASHVGIVVRSAISQSANLQEWQNSSGVAVASITASGNLNVNIIDCGSP